MLNLMCQLGRMSVVGSNASLDVTMKAFFLDVISQ